MLCDEKPAAVSDAWFTLWRDDGWRIAVCVNFRRGEPRGVDEVGGQMRQLGDMAADECAVGVEPAGGLDNIDGTPAGVAGGGLPVAFVQRGVEIGLLRGEPSDAVFGRLM